MNGNGGGNGITIEKIVEIETGYDNPNHYKIQLGKKFNNIVRFNLISTEIPNTRFTFENYIEDRIFSKNIDKSTILDQLYWLNKEDSAFVYNYFMLSDQTLFHTFDIKDYLNRLTIH